MICEENKNMIKKVKTLSKEKQNTNEKSNNEPNKIESGEEKVKFFTEIKQSTRELIDNIKDKEEITIGTIIDKAVQTFNNYLSMEPGARAILEKYEPDYGSKIKEVEEAVKLLDHQKKPQTSDVLDLWCRAREEMQMMLIGKTTFNQLLAAAETPEESLDKPMKRNIAQDVIIWYTGKLIKNLSLEEIVQAIEKVWIMSNYFYLIDVRQESKDQYLVIFKHHQNKRYSNYWLGYFRELFQSEELSYKCVIEGEALDETLSMTIKKLHDK